MGVVRDDQLRICAGECGRMTRNAKTSAAQYPGTVSRFSGDYCQKDWRALPENAPDPEVVAARERARQEKLNAGYEAAFAAREQFEAQRRARLGRAKRKVFV